MVLHTSEEDILINREKEGGTPWKGCGLMRDEGSGDMEDGSVDLSPRGVVYTLCRAVNHGCQTYRVGHLRNHSVKKPSLEFLYPEFLLLCGFF